MSKSLSFRVLITVFLSLVVTGVPFALIITHLHRRSVMTSLEDGTVRLTRVIIAQLERFMQIQEPHLTEQYLLDLVAHNDLQRVYIVSKRGEVIFSSNPLMLGKQVSGSDSLCVECHAGKATIRSRFEKRGDGGGFLSVASLVRNREACHSCHDPAQASLGVVVVDVPLDAAVGEIRTTRNWIVMTGVWMLATTMVVLMIVFRRNIIRPVHHLADYLAALRSSPVSEPHSSLAGLPLFGGLSRDITELFEEVDAGRREIQKQRSFLANIIDNLQEEITVINDRREIVLANQAFLDRTPADCRAPFCNRETGECMALNCLRERRPSTRVVKEGELTYLVSIFPMTAAEEVFAVEVRQDLTRLKLIEQQVMRTDRLAMIGFLAAGVAHQVNSPLNVLTGNLEAIQRDGKINTRRLDHMFRAIDRLREVSKKMILLASSKDDQVQVIDPDEMIRRCLKLIQLDMRNQGIEAFVTFGGDGTALMLPPVHFEHVVLNLLVNAVQAMPEGGGLHVETGLQNGHYVIRVKDEGDGIDPENIHKIFEATFSTKGAAGTGFGLFLVRQFLDGMGGDIEVDSFPGSGSTFTVRLPVSHE